MIMIVKLPGQYVSKPKEQVFANNVKFSVSKYYIS